MISKEANYEFLSELFRDVEDLEDINQKKTKGRAPRVVKEKTEKRYKMDDDLK